MCVCVCVCVQGYKQRKGFIIVQSPMASTARDFVKMLYERECGVVVMLCGCEEGGVEMCAQYWPSSAGTMMKYGEFLVSTVSMNENDGVTQRVITITDPKIVTTLVHLQLCTSLIHVYTTISLVRFKK